MRATRPICAEPKLNRLDWTLFKRSAYVEEGLACVVDILAGEPMVEDDIGDYRGWYGYHRPRKNVTSKDQKGFVSMVPGQPPLPERIRIHSAALVQILSTILGKELEPGRPVVFIRPFKALVYAELALRDWCTALDKKFKAASETGGGRSGCYGQLRNRCSESRSGARNEPGPRRCE